MPSTHSSQPAAATETAVSAGDWLAIVKTHHAAIAKAVEELLATGMKAGATRDTALKKLAYQLTAHCVAEENVIYPALAMHGMTFESDKLYLDQAHAKVMNAEVDMAAMTDKGNVWLDKAKALQAAVLKHAKEDEEANFYLKLKQKLDARQNAMLTAEHQHQYASVKAA